jgi:hypothetical protein
MKTVVDLAVQTLGPVLFVLLLAGAVLGIVIGGLLVFDSARVMRWNDALNRWFSSGNTMQLLDQSVEIKRGVYRWHRLVGMLLFGGAFFTLDALAFGFTTTALVRTLRGSGSGELLGLVFESVRIFLIIGNVFALLAAVVLVFRPSMLKGLENWADRSYSYSGRESAEKLNAMRYQPDDFVRTRPKVVGTVVLLGSIYALAGLSLLLH